MNFVSRIAENLAGCSNSECALLIVSIFCITVLVICLVCFLIYLLKEALKKYVLKIVNSQINERNEYIMDYVIPKRFLELKKEIKNQQVEHYSPKLKERIERGCKTK